MKFSITLLLAIASVSSAASEFRKFDLGYPENMLVVQSNAARIDPNGFSNEARRLFPDPTFNLQVICPPPANLGPVYPYSGLTSAAKAHCSDMVANGFFEHDSSPAAAAQYGTANSMERVASYVGDYDYLAENIIAGDAYKEETMIKIIAAWLGHEGHCENLLNPKANLVGMDLQHGLNVKGRDLDMVSTQDFAGSGISGNPPIAAAGHVPTSPSSADIVAAIFSDSKSVVNAVVNGVSHAMKVNLGTASRGRYQVSVDSLPQTCNSYHVEVVVAGAVVDRFPAVGESLLNGCGGCQKPYTATEYAAPVPTPTPTPAVTPDNSAVATPAAIGATNASIPSCEKNATDAVVKCRIKVLDALSSDNTTTPLKCRAKIPTVIGSDNTAPPPKCHEKNPDAIASDSTVQAALKCRVKVPKAEDKVAAPCDAAGSYSSKTFGTEAGSSSIPVGGIAGAAACLAAIVVFAALVYKRKRVQSGDDTEQPGPKPWEYSVSVDQIQDPATPITPASPHPLLGGPKKVQQWKLFSSKV